MDDALQCKRESVAEDWATTGAVFPWGARLCRPSAGRSRLGAAFRGDIVVSKMKDQIPGRGVDPMSAGRVVRQLRLRISPALHKGASRAGRQLGADHAGQGLELAHSTLCPVATLIRQDLEAGGLRAGRLIDASSRPESTDLREARSLERLEGQHESHDA